MALQHSNRQYCDWIKHLNTTEEHGNVCLSESGTTVPPGGDKDAPHSSATSLNSICFDWYTELFMFKYNFAQYIV